MEAETDNLEAFQKGFIAGYNHLFLHASDGTYIDLVENASDIFAQYADEKELSLMIFEDILDGIQDLVTRYVKANVDNDD